MFTLALILVFVFGTALLSGIFGMAGGLILMALLVNMLPTAQAMVLHGLLQWVANGWRSFLLRHYIQWRIVGFYFVGSAAILCLFLFISFVPNKAIVLISIGLLPLFLWPPFNYVQFDITKPHHAILCGMGATVSNLLAGVAAGLLDLFYAKTSLNRHKVVASKSATQAIAHTVKIIIYGRVLWLGMTNASDIKFLLFIFIAGVPISMLGTHFGRQILEKLSENQFRSYTIYIISAIGIMLLMQGCWLLFFQSN